MTFLPSSAYNISASLEAYRRLGDDGGKIVTIPDDLNLNNHEDVWTAAIDGDTYFDVDHASGTEHDVTDAVTQRLSQGFIYFGVTSNTDYGTGEIYIYLTVNYTLPINLTVDNNFTAPNGTHGKISVDGNANYNAPYNFSRNNGTNVTIGTLSLQNDNQSRNDLAYRSN